MHCSEEKDFVLLRQVTTSDVDFLQVHEMTYSHLEFSSVKEKRSQRKTTDIIIPKKKRGLEIPAPLPSQNNPQAKYNLGTIALSLT